MIALYGWMAALTIAAAVWLSRPWWRRDSAAPMRRRDANVAAYRQRLDEIQTEAEVGLIQPDAARALRDEAGLRLVDDAAGTAEAAEPAPHRPVWRGAALLGLLLAVFSVGYYGWAGSWRIAAIVAGEAQPREPTMADVETLLTQLEQRLEQNPDDVDGWAMLGRSRFALQRFEPAAQAFAKANELTQRQNADLLTAEGEALGMARERNLQGEPRELFDRALGLSPDHAKALWYAGMAALQAGDKARTLELWTHLRQQQMPTELQTILDQQLAELRGEAPATPPMAAAPETAQQAATPSAVAIDVSLNLAPELASKLPAGAMLIVYAKAESGPPMPLAVVRQPVGRFPLRLRLDDSQAMMPNLKLSQFERWEITARIGRGQAKAESGELQGSIRIGKAEAAQPVQLTIDTVVP